jgi:hypothetical protein
MRTKRPEGNSKRAMRHCQHKQRTAKSVKNDSPLLHTVGKERMADYFAQSAPRNWTRKKGQKESGEKLHKAVSEDKYRAIFSMASTQERKIL